MDLSPLFQRVLRRQFDKYHFDLYLIARQISRFAPKFGKCEFRAMKYRPMILQKQIRAVTTN